MKNFFYLLLVISLLTKNVFLAFFCIIILIILDDTFIIPAILISPIIEPSFIISQGITLTKVLVLFLSIYFGFYLLKKNSFLIDETSFLLSIYMLIVLNGILIIISNSSLISVIPLSYKTILIENFLVYLPKIIFAILFYQFLVKKGDKFIKKSLEKSVKFLSFFIPITIIYYFLFYCRTLNWNNIVYRLTPYNADPNEFSGLVIAIGIFSVYAVLFEKGLYKYLGRFSVLIISAVPILTGSRGGIITFIFTFFTLIIILPLKRKFKLISFIFLSLAIIFFLNLELKIINVKALSKRFFISDISSLTNKRWDFWQDGLKAFFEKPLFGYGSSSYVSRYINLEKIGIFKVFHNTYIEIIVQYGIIGFMFFSLILLKALKGFSIVTLRRNYLLMLPYLSLISLLFMGISLSWQWREELWFLLSICFSIQKIIKREKISNKALTFRTN